MKFLLSFIVTALLSFALCLFLPWWSIAIAAFGAAVALPLKPWLSFTTGFVSLFLLWSLLALAISIRNHHLLAHKIALLLLKTDSPLLLIAATGFVGGLVGGVAALCGSYVRAVKA